MPIQAGKTVERLMFGQPLAETMPYETFLKLKTADSIRADVVRTIVSAREKIEKVQAPPTTFARRFETDLIKRLIPLESDLTGKFFSSVGTRLDYEAGTDGYFAIKNRRTNETLATFNIDVSVNLTSRKLMATGIANHILYVDKDEYIATGEHGDYLKDSFFDSVSYLALLKAAETKLREEFRYKHLLKPPVTSSRPEKIILPAFKNRSQAHESKA